MFFLSMSNHEVIAVSKVSIQLPTGRKMLVGLMPVMVVLLAVATYLPAVDNFFTWDDFVWLQRSATLFSKPSQLMNIDAIYFDPLVYLLFKFNYLLAPFDYRWYHALDICIHAANGILVWILARRLTTNLHSALASCLFFTISFATVDAVVWSSSRVDLLAVFFSLVTLIAYHRHLTDQEIRPLILALSAYIMALGAKGTPVVIPGILAFMLFQHNAIKNRWKSLIPFAGVTAAYFVALTVKLTGTDNGLTHSGTLPNVKNFILAFTELFIPERWVALGPYTAAAIAVILVTILSLVVRSESLRKPKMLALFIIAAGLLPVLVLKDFKLATTIDNAGLLLNSPSHRIYFASIGMALLYGTFIGEITGFTHRKTSAFILCSLFIVWSMYEIRNREKLWDGSAKYIRGSVEGIAKFKGMIVNDSTVGLVNFPMSRGFMRPVFSLYCGVDDVLFLPLSQVPEEILDSPEILRYQNRGYFFVYGKQVHNLSDQFNQILTTAFNHQIAPDQANRDALFRDYQSRVRKINNSISVMQSL